MDTREFLEAVWPSQGLYCLASPRAEGGYQHVVVDTIDKAVAAAVKGAETRDIFFAVHTLKERRVWDPAKKNYQTGELGDWAVRKQTNMHEARCFFFDLDIGDDPKKYATRQEALDGLEAFLFNTGLPSPLITSSGGGYHLYWRLSEAIPSVEWRTHAAKLRWLAGHHGLRADPARTLDQSSVLRVVGTFNYKKDDRRPVAVVAVGERAGTADFIGRLDTLVGDAVIPATSSNSTYVPPGEGNLAKVWDGPISTLDEVANVCEHVREYRRASEAGERIDEPVWYAMVGLTHNLEDGDRWVRTLGKSNRTVVQKLEKLEQWNRATGGQPPSCAKLNESCGGDACARCPFASFAKNPLLIASEVRKREAAAARPVVAVDTSVVEPSLVIEPPFPYTRDHGKIRKETTKVNKDGIEITENPVVCPYDIYPFAACERTELEPAFSLWAVDIPLKGQVTVKLQNTIMLDNRALSSRLANDGMILNKKQVDAMMDFLPAYMRALQSHQRASRQYDHLGWVDEDRTAFIMPTTVLNVDGTEKPCTLSGMARGSLEFVRQKGSLAEQVKLMSFYNRPDYLRHQFMVLCGLGSPMFHATGHLGVVVNASGDSGGSKSTALYAAGALWGHPTDYVIDGTEKGSTVLGRIETVRTLCNLPVCIDEITKMDPDDVQNFVLGVTQKGDRIRLNPDGTLKAIRGGHKSTYYLTSSNSSLHNLLAINNRAGIAGDMRVFEMIFPKIPGSSTPGTEFVHALKQHYGWIGPAVLRIYMADRERYDGEVRALNAQLNTECLLVGAERFWSGAMAAAIVAGRIAFKAGLLPFDTEAMITWFKEEQLPHMRGEVGAELAATSPVALLSSFLNDKASQTIVILPPTHDEAQRFAQRQPNGAIVAHYDQHTQVLNVRKDAFRDWCNTRSKNALSAMRDLLRTNVIVGMDQKVTLGRGTPYASGRSVCFTVDMTHPDIAATGSLPKVVPLKQAGAA